MSNKCSCMKKNLISACFFAICLLVLASLMDMSVFAAGKIKSKENSKNYSSSENQQTRRTSATRNRKSTTSSTSQKNKTSSSTEDTIAAGAVTYLPSYKSWIQGSKIWNDTYGTIEVTGEDSFDDEPPEPNWVEKAFSSILAGIGDVINKWVAGPFHMRTSEVILGRLNKNVTMNMYCFELTAMNPYGMTGARFYSLFRNIALLCMLPIFMFVLMRAAGNSNTNALVKLKDDMTTYVLIFLLLTIMPQIIDILIYVKDLLIKMIIGLIYSDPTKMQTVDITEFFRTNYYGDVSDDGTVLQEPNKTIIYALMYLCASFVGLRFGFSYIKIALKQTALFCVLPIVLILAIFNKNILFGWCKRFIPNVYIPSIDCMLIMIPVVFEQVLRTNISASVAGTGILSTTGSDYAMLAGTIQLVMMFSIIPVRQYLLEMFGAVPARDMGRGLSGAMLMMASRLAMRGAFGGGVRGGRENSLDSLRNTAESAERAALEDGLIRKSGANGGYGNTLQNIGYDQEFEKRFGSSSNVAAMGANGGEINGPSGNDFVKATDDRNSFEQVASGNGVGVDGNVNYEGPDMDYLNGTDQISADSSGYYAEEDRLKNLEDIDAANDTILGNDAALSEIAVDNANYEQRISDNTDALDVEEEIQRQQLGGMSASELIQEKTSLQQQNERLQWEMGSTTSDIGQGADTNAIQEQINSNNHRIARIDQNLAQPNVVQSIEKANALRSAIASDSAAMKQNNLDAKKLRADSQQQKVNIANYAQNEQAYAEKDYLFGGTGNSYDSAKDYHAAQNMRALANYTNYDMPQYKNVLTKQEEAEFARERYERERKRVMAQQTVQGVATAASLPAVATVAAVAAASRVGDERSVVDSTVISGVIAGGVASGIARGAGVAASNAIHPTSPVQPVETVRTEEASARIAKRNGNISAVDSSKLNNSAIYNSDTTGRTQKDIEELRNIVNNSGGEK